MDKKIEECINILISLEPIFKRAGKLALEMRQTAASRYKLDTGIHGIDIVTEADLAVQEAILSEMAKTKLIECRLIAEEDTPSAKLFRGINGLILTLDPIDGTFIYAADGRLFSVIVCLNDGQQPLYTFCHYPVVDWTRRIARDTVSDFGIRPRVNVKEGLDLSRTIAHTFGEPEKTAGDIYNRLINEGYQFRLLPEITLDSGSCTLFFLGQVAGYYTQNPGAYDGICTWHYGRVKKSRMFGELDISKAIDGPHGPYYPGWYIVLY